MVLGSVQKELLKILEKEGKIENLGVTYHQFSKSARTVKNETILSFVDKVKSIYPETELIRGKRGGLWTATLTIKRSEK